MKFLLAWFLAGVLDVPFAKGETPRWRAGHSYPGPLPQEIMVDSVNYIGLVLLQAHNQNNDNNIALSPYGATSVLVALGEGVQGTALDEILSATLLPLDVSITRVGLRDIHRHLKSYFIPQEGFLAGLTFSHENVTLKSSYEDIIKFYGYDVDSFNNALYPDPYSSTTISSSETTESISLVTNPVNISSTTEQTTPTTVTIPPSTLNSEDTTQQTQTVTDSTTISSGTVPQSTITFTSTSAERTSTLADSSQFATDAVNQITTTLPVSVSTAPSTTTSSTTNTAAATVTTQATSPNIAGTTTTAIPTTTEISSTIVSTTTTTTTSSDKDTEKLTTAYSTKPTTVVTSTTTTPVPSTANPSTVVTSTTTTPVPSTTNPSTVVTSTTTDSTTRTTVPSTTATGIVINLLPSTIGIENTNAVTTSTVNTPSTLYTDSAGSISINLQPTTFASTKADSDIGTSSSTVDTVLTSILTSTTSAGGSTTNTDAISIDNTNLSTGTTAALTQSSTSSNDASTTSAVTTALTTPLLEGTTETDTSETSTVNTVTTAAVAEISTPTRRSTISITASATPAETSTETETISTESTSSNTDTLATSTESSTTNIDIPSTTILLSTITIPPDTTANSSRASVPLIIDLLPSTLGSESTSIGTTENSISIITSNSSLLGGFAIDVQPTTVSPTNANIKSGIVEGERTTNRVPKRNSLPKFRNDIELIKALESENKSASIHKVTERSLISQTNYFKNSLDSGSEITNFQNITDYVINATIAKIETTSVPTPFKSDDTKNPFFSKSSMSTTDGFRENVNDTNISNYTEIDMSNSANREADGNLDDSDGEVSEEESFSEKTFDDSSILPEFNNKRKNVRSTRSVVDYLIARYHDNNPSHAHYSAGTDYEPAKATTFAVNGKIREPNINFMTYDTVLPFRYISYLNALAMTFPLDSSKYYLLLILPVDEMGIDHLINNMMSTTLKQIIYHLQPTRVKATIPSFMLKGYVVLTPTLQKLGIRQIFEPRHADFSRMTEDKDIYVTNIEQAVTVTIRNYVDPSTLQNNQHFRRRGPVQFTADHPFLYFVMDSQIHVALMAGKIINPLNSRIR